MAKKLAAGDQAPEIDLPDQDGKPRRLADLRGKWVLVYFYPRDDTPGCTVEACGLRDAWSRFTKARVEVLGINADSAKSHRKFVDKYSLPFTLLSDEEKKVVRAYGAWGKKKFMGREFDGVLRQSFLIDPDGMVAKVYPKVKPDGHASEILRDVEFLAGVRSSTRPAASPPRKSAPTKKPAPGKKTVKKAPTKSRGGPRPSTVRKTRPKG